MFAWRVCHDILPTKENLGRRKLLITDPVRCASRGMNLCSMCYGSVELHKMCGPVASCMCMQKCTTFRTDFLKLVEDLMERLQVERTWSISL